MTTTEMTRAPQRAAANQLLDDMGLRPHPYGLRAPCSLCSAREGDACLTRSGRQLTYAHRVRVSAVDRQITSRLSRLVLVVDDERFGLARGDILIGHPYAYDSKWTILRRESDGFDPECNQYSSSVRWIGWAPQSR